MASLPLRHLVHTTGSEVDVMACNDRLYGSHTIGPRPRNIHPNFAPWYLQVPGCGGVTPPVPCAGYHPGRDFLVCNNCNIDNNRRLLLASGSVVNNAAPLDSTGNKDYPLNNRDRIADHSVGVAPQWDQWTPFGATPALPAGPTIPAIPTTETPPWGGFLTRVCNECERKLRSEQNAYISGASALPPSSIKWKAVPVPGVVATQVSTCICEYELTFRNHRNANNRLCHRHRNQKLRELEKKKDANDVWLRNIMLHPRTGNIVQATPARLNQRCDQGTWRACRCGNELDNTFQVEVLLCMACEGTVTVTNFAASMFPLPVPGPAAPPPGWFQPMYSPAEVKRFRDKANFKLGRVALK
ncbi:hypothetical protein LTR56_024185 [Elasticomyces elasticus]|nr:hypothetical protein LTR56_024185 [Elasticomyces elasticus]KAK3640578.1 hypothetical protein LTR22_016954 [Elasticomyces elasticus]KAK5759960.1 hypothetical protein LTS12_009856 [Elasticomyces elasticus]